MIKATLHVDQDGKKILKNIPCELKVGEHEIDIDILYSVGNREPKTVSEFNLNLYAECKNILKKNTISAHIGWHSLSVLIDHLEEKYDMEVK